MTIKEELEILRGEPIEVCIGDPMDIPCIETSDPEKLCNNPIVSVHMITYNHEPYIRQAIEGVMMQKTDFEFELVIGEDASTDKTREICFEYQKRYPGSIRVLWWHENLRKIGHPAGGNSARVMAHCRGEFIAFCEGDDYWIDPLKLQKQVDVMRKYPNVGLCFTGARIYKDDDSAVWKSWNKNKTGFEPGLIDSQQYVLWTTFGKNPVKGWGDEWWQMTATFLVRTCTLISASEKYEIFSWKLFVGDSVLCLGVGSISDAYYLQDETAVYRQTRTGITRTKSCFCGRDTILVRFYYLVNSLHLSYEDATPRLVASYINNVLDIERQKNGKIGVRQYLWRVRNSNASHVIFRSFRSRLISSPYRHEGASNRFVTRVIRVITNMAIVCKPSKRLRMRFDLFESRLRSFKCE